MAPLSDDENTPISSVPDEILAEILLMCTDPLPRPRPHEAPVVFTRVSRWFRNVALTTPRLWSNVAIPYSNDPGNRHSHPQYLALITDWLLVRSGATPLTITFICGDGGTASTAALFKVFYSCMERWQSIDVTGLHDSLLLEMTQLHETNTPWLRSLSLRPSVDSGFLLYARILLSPKLQRLTIQSSTPFTIHPDMSWTHLTDIYLPRFVGPIIKLLGQTNHLRSLRLDAESFSDDNRTRNPIDLPELVTLNHSLQLFFAHLSSPLLEDLDVGSYEIGSATPTELVDFISHTKHLKTFSAGNIDYHSLASIIRFTPKLKKLLIDIFPSFTMEQSNDILNAFVAEDVDERVCSHLEELHCYSGLDPDDETVRRLYERKLGNISGISTWTTCHIVFTRQRSYKLLSQLGASRDIWTALDIHGESATV